MCVFVSLSPVARTFPDIAVCGAELPSAEQEAGAVMGVALTPRAKPPCGRAAVVRPQHLVYIGAVLIGQGGTCSIAILLGV